MTKEYNLSLSNFVDIMGVSRNTVNIWVRNGVYKMVTDFLRQRHAQYRRFDRSQRNP